MKYKVTVEVLKETMEAKYPESTTIYEQTIETEMDTFVQNIIKAVNII